jgi:arginine decarboxylase
VSCFGREHVGAAGFADLDRTRVTLNVAGTGFTGFEIERRLNAHGVYPEMATLEHLLFLVTPGTADADVDTLLRWLRRVCEGARQVNRRPAPPVPSVPPMAMIPRMAKFSKKIAVPLHQAIGRIAGETVATYPPGSPVIAAGEIVSVEVVEYLEQMRLHGAALKGAADVTLQTLKVVA